MIFKKSFKSLFEPKEKERKPGKSSYRGNILYTYKNPKCCWNDSISALKLFGIDI